MEWRHEQDTITKNINNEGDDSEGDDNEGDDSEGDDREGDDSEGDDNEGDDSEGDEIKLQNHAAVHDVKDDSHAVFIYKIKDKKRSKMNYH